MNLFNNLITYLFLAIVIFLILREFMAWYWKTNEIIKLLEEIKRSLRAKNTLDKEEPKL
jgi:hypothetical protein